MLARVESIDKFDKNVMHSIAQMKSSDQLRHRCTRSCTERHPTNH